MSLYHYQYKKKEIPHYNRIKRIYFLFGLTLGLFLFVMLLPLSLFFTSKTIASPVSTNAQMKKEIIPTTLTPSPTPYHLDNDRGLDGNTSPTPSLSLSQTDSTDSNRFQPILTKKLYTIAIIGDSMVDTMGEALEYLDAALKKKYPDAKFLLYNYGTGAQNIEMGLNRFNSHFKYQSRDYQSLPELKPDILIVASFSYNPFTPHDRNKHWLTLTQLVQSAQSVSSNVYMLAEIAPLRNDFGKRPQGVNWSDDTNYEHSGRIIEQLENAVGLAKTLNVPLIDAFTPSLDSSTKQGLSKYVNPSDGIHPSVEGHQFMAEKIAQTLKFP